MRILSIGMDLDFATDCASFTDDVNVKDYDLALIDLYSLDVASLKAGSRLSELFENGTVSLPKSLEVLKAIESGTDFLVTLPIRKQAPNRKSRMGVSNLNYLSFIPGQSIDVEEESGESIDGETIAQDWGWYFPTGGFSWSLHFGNQTKKTSYEELQVLRTPVPLVKNGFDRAISTRLEFGGTAGSVYLIPILDDWESESLSREFLDRIILDKSPDLGEDLPEWIHQYSVPGESELNNEVEDLEEKIKQLENEQSAKEEDLSELRRYKGLLYGGDDFLERLVPKIFREFGFNVDGEDPHHRDALIDFSDCFGVVEIHGTSGGIARSKCRQLDEWVGDLDMDHPDRDHLGLLIVNPMRDDPPDKRSGYMTPDIESYLSDRGYSILMTPDLFQMYVDFEEGDLTKEEIDELITGDETAIEYSG